MEAAVSKGILRVTLIGLLAALAVCQVSVRPAAAAVDVYMQFTESDGGTLTGDADVNVRRQ
jgi:hypothetical protein